MHTTDGRATVTGQNKWGPQVSTFTVLLVLIVIAVTSAACARPARSGSSPTERDAALRRIAADFAQDGDLAGARDALARLNLANPAQLVVSMAEQSIRDGRSADETEQLVALAEALGARSPQLVGYRAARNPSVTPSPVPVLPSPTVEPAVATATAVPSDTPLPAPSSTATIPPPTSTASATIASQPRVVARNAVNVRSGPGTAYPVVGQIKAGQELRITGRNASGDWWQLAWTGPQQAWVAGTIVDVKGPIDTVAVVKNIPTPPPTRTPAPTVPPVPTQPPKPSVAYVVKSTRLRPVGQDAQQCHGGENSIFAYVVDAGGNRLDGVRVRELLPTDDQRIYVSGSGSWGPGTIQHAIWRGGGGQLDIVDEAGNRISEITRSMSADWPDFDLMKAGGYCNCKPHPDDASCEADLQNHTYLFAVGHYTYEVVFQRTW